jgi:hypothetical protein
LELPSKGSFAAGEAISASHYSFQRTIAWRKTVRRAGLGAGGVGMKSHRGPPGNGNGARQSADPKTEKLEKSYRTSLGFVNDDRQLHGFSRWSFNLLFPATGKFERLTKGGIS